MQYIIFTYDNFSEYKTDVKALFFAIVMVCIVFICLISELPL
ncbi:hypothetical protein ATN83_3652 [Raoultella ornithinolytica]|nr:hypothetical protein ATN83_3652 [Raoultella ornithinolytica]KDV95531.1 hypothetical protein AB00_1132 [Raoultella ornithinolytica 2-156-04_S1_C1]KDX15048.1 hypothetical protein AB28_1145 [Raoultella ornithinolytica 2-156-04_S1_C2]